MLEFEGILEILFNFFFLEKEIKVLRSGNVVIMLGFFFDFEEYVFFSMF